MGIVQQQKAIDKDLQSNLVTSFLKEEGGGKGERKKGLKFPPCFKEKKTCEQQLLYYVQGGVGGLAVALCANLPWTTAEGGPNFGIAQA